jgi:UDP-glucose:(heptosyl)LPS alpha-1,3-glucosyltransferase
VKIAFLLYKYFPYGGMQRDFKRFVEETQARGHQCRVYYYSWQGDPLAGVDLRKVPVSAMTNHRRNELYHAWVQQDLARDPADGVVGFNKMPDLDVYYAADSCYADWVALDRGFLYRRSARYRHFSSWEYLVFGPDSKTEILMISETERVKFERHYPAARDRLHMLPPGISRDRCAPPDADERRARIRQSLGVSDSQHMLLFVGSGFIKKGLGRAIRAVANLRTGKDQSDIVLFVAGQDRERRFRWLAKRLGVGDSIRFLGGRDDVADLLLGADCLIHPALDEAAGIVLLEALVAGLPVLVTDTCGYACHIEAAGAGTVLPSPFLQASLDSAVAQSLDPAFLARCKRNALDYAEREDLYSMHTTGAALIEDFLQRKAIENG